MRVICMLHQGAKSGKVTLRCDQFELFRQVPQIERHRMVFKALGGLLETDIHAISLDTSAPD